MRLIHSSRLLLLLILFAGSRVAAQVQPPPQAAPNPLMQLMSSQPSVDVSSPVVAVTSFDPPVVVPGERAVYRVTMNALEAAIRWPAEIPATAGLKLRLSAHGQILQAETNMFRPLTTFVYDVRAAKAGFFTVPAFYVEVYGKPVLIPTADLEAIEEAPESHKPAKQLVLECGATNVFSGETITVRVLSHSSDSNSVQSIFEVQLNGDGFMASKSAVKRTIQPLERNGRKVPTYIYETTVTPIASGELNLSAQAFTAGNLFSGPITIQGSVTIPGGPPQYLLLDSEPVALHVKPLPTEGRLPGFTGAIGKYSYDPPKLATNTVRAGDPVQLTVTIRGHGDLNRLVPPPAPRVKDWQVFAAVPAGLVAGVGKTNPGAVFNYTLIPATDEASSTPAIPFSCFDPERAVYVDLTIPQSPVKVVANGMPTNWPSSLELLEENSGAEKKPVLSGLAQSRGRTASGFVPVQLRGWFPAVQLFPAFAFFGLWVWDRRRRHLEQHPEIVRRREARRQLRRQKRLLNRAAARGDSPGFTRSSVAAMQIACAPHYPADPRALVCADVLNLLSTTDRQSRAGEAVRRFFAAADDSSFAASPQDHVEVLALKTDLDEVLLKLEEQL